jgi:hypothetical protein
LELLVEQNWFSLGPCVVSREKELANSQNGRWRARRYSKDLADRPM